MNEAVPSMEKPIITYEDLKAKVRAAQASGKKINTMDEYRYFVHEAYTKSFTEDPNNPIELPRKPEEELLDWGSEEDFLGLNEKAKEIKKKETDYSLPY